MKHTEISKFRNEHQRQVVLATKEVLRRSPDLEGDTLEDEVQSILDEWDREEAFDRELAGEPSDTPTVASCDFWGTGEGRYHGVIG